MATSRDNILDIFQTKIQDFTYLQYTDEEIIEEFSKFLDNAKGRFYSCDKLKKYDEILEEFVEDLDLDEIEITTEIMVLMWVEKQVQDISKFKDRLSSKDYKELSKANLLDKILNVKKDKTNEIDKLMGIYGTQLVIKKLRGDR